MIQESSGGGLLGGMMQDIGGVFSKAFGGGSGNSEDKLFGFLASNQMSEKIIEKFNLVDYYEITKYKRAKTLKAFKDDFKFDLNDNGFIEISMIHKNPEISADIVNFATEELDRMSQEYAITYAKKYREFVEKRYFKNMNDLKDAELSLEKFHKETGIFAIPEQIEVAFKAYSELETQLSIKELERDLVKETQGEKNPSMNVVETQVNLLKKKISDLKNGKQLDKSLIFLKIDELPNVQLRFLQIKRELEIQAKLLEFTLPMYEQAVMEEQKTIPTITVIDKAIAPELKDSPKKAFIILSIFFLALFLQLPLIFRGYKLANNLPQNSFEEKEKRYFEKIVKLYKIKE
jgi:capsule polysaccharide export protein KpsE/RkpR